MKLTVERSALMKALGHAYRVVEKRNNIPILSNVLLKAEDGQLRLRATDLDIEVTESVPAEITAEGATAVPAHMLHDIVRKLPDDASVSLELQGTQVQIRSGRSRFMLSSLPEADFPDLGTFAKGQDGATSFTVTAAALKALMDGTAFAISNEETRYYLNGIYLHAPSDDAGTHLRAVSTDGHRLARHNAEAPEGSRGMPGVIVPKKTVTEVEKLVDEFGEDVSVDLTASKIRFDFGGLVLTSKLIDGTFPDYQRVIPMGNDKRLLVHRDTFAKAVDRVSTVSSERGRAVKLSIADNLVTLVVTNPESGTATEEVEAEYAAAPVDIGFNAKYLLECIAKIKGDQIEFMLADPGSPTLIRDPLAEAGLYVLMPMRV